MTTSDSIILDAANRVFKDYADPQTIIASKNDAWSESLWDAVSDMGMLKALVREEQGGIGLPLSEGFALVRECGRHGIAVPLVETIAANWIADQAELVLPPGAASVIFADEGACVRVNGSNVFRLTMTQVPFAHRVQSLVLVAKVEEQTMVCIVQPTDCIVEGHASLSGDANDLVCFETVLKDVRFHEASIYERAIYLCAVCRSLQIAGALEKILEIAVDYAKERVAFGKKIANFQAVQHLLARLGGEAAAALAASGSAADTLGDATQVDELQVLLEVAAAKVRCGEAAEAGSAIAHQVLGAIGFTEEHILHRFTLRCLSWREDFGNETFWSEKLGAAVDDMTGDQVWNLLTTR